MYHEELSRLQQSAIASAMKEQTERSLAITPGLGSDQEKSEVGEVEVEIKREVLKPPASLTPPALPVKLGQHKSPFFPHSPKLEGEMGGASIGSPLQRMANITNSLVTTPPSVSFGSPARSNFKSVLPPITQQQFDR